MREASKRVRREGAVVELRALPDEYVRDIVFRLVDEAALAAGRAIADPSAGPTAGVARDLVLDKHLSPNDIGDTGSHQAAIAIGANWAEAITRLDESTVNPSAELSVLFRRLETKWTWRLVHYNGRRFNTSTRDEYRITGVGDFLRRAGARTGERMRLYRVGEAFEVELGE